MEKGHACILLVNTETMQANNIMNADMLDILFEHKNKAYGAYNLRRTYDKRLYSALVATFAVGLLFTLTTLFAGDGKKNAMTPPPVIDIILDKQHEEKPKEKIVEPLPAAPAPAPRQTLEQIRVTNVTPPQIVRDDQVTADNTVPPVADLDKTIIGNVNIAGGDDPGSVAPPVNGTGLGGTGLGCVGGGGNEVVDEKGVVSVQIEARFPGGPEAWRKFLEKNLNRDLPVENGATAGRYTVIVSFVVDKEGMVSDVKAENNPGHGTAEEAVRVIKRGPKWQPAVQNGRNVTYRQRQSITFEVNEE
jgi:protein TonB